MSVIARKPRPDDVGGNGCVFLHVEAVVKVEIAQNAINEDVVIGPTWKIYACEIGFLKTKLQGVALTVKIPDITAMQNSMFIFKALQK